VTRSSANRPHVSYSNDLAVIDERSDARASKKFE
jgi:hypothetical protein